MSRPKTYANGLPEKVLAWLREAKTRNRGCGKGELATLCGVDPKAIDRTLGRMQKNGLCRRDSSAGFTLWFAI